MIDPTDAAQLKLAFPQFSDDTAAKVANQCKQNIDHIDALIYTVLNEKTKSGRLIASAGLRMLSVMYLTHGFDLPVSLRSYLAKALKTGDQELLGLIDWKPKKRGMIKRRKIAIEFEMLLVNRRDTDDKYSMDKSILTVTEEISKKHGQSVSVTERDRAMCKDFILALRSFCDFREWPTDEQLELASLLSKVKWTDDCANKHREMIDPPIKNKATYLTGASLTDTFSASPSPETPTARDLHLKPRTK